jgi:hypothetical protein
VSYVFQNIDLTFPSPPGKCVLPRYKGGGYSLAGRRGRWGVNIWPLRGIISLRDWLISKLAHFRGFNYYLVPDFYSNIKFIPFCTIFKKSKNFRGLN